jgi:DUF971 family protein
MLPIKIKVIDKKDLYIQWDNSSENTIPLAVLRRNCPCANCLMERQTKPESYIPLFSHVQLTLSDIKVVGSYAVQLVWHDGHDDGIYNYDFLRELGNITSNPSPNERG